MARQTTASGVKTKQIDDDTVMYVDTSPSFDADTNLLDAEDSSDFSNLLYIKLLHLIETKDVEESEVAPKSL